jgi:CubicO group peptidase (beta-lactamase class C family)
LDKKLSQPYANNTDIKIPGENAGRLGYAYSWWTKKISLEKTGMNIFWANGWGGQIIIVIPEKNALVVFTGGEYNSGSKQFSLFEDYILPLVAMIK